MPKRPLFFDFFTALVEQMAGTQQLIRMPEPEGVTDQTENVIQYGQVMGTKLVLAYGCGLMIVHRARPETVAGSAIDLACGPGHYTLCLARHLEYEKVIGIDLAPPMVELATRNAAEQGLAKRVEFRVGDVTKLDQLESDQLDLTSFTDAAHHMSDLQTVRSILREMDRITKPDGLVMVMDVARLRTAKLTDRFVNTLGQDYVERGLPDFLDDFRNSMFAAWTPKELHQAIPTGSDRWWCHIVPRGLPTIQVILGLPVGRKKAFVRPGVPWNSQTTPIPKEMNGEWKILQICQRFASRRLIPPQDQLKP